MIKVFFKDINEINSRIKIIMIKGYKFSLLISLFSCYILALYNSYPFSHVVFLSGMNLLKFGLTCFVAFFVCGFGIDKIIR